MDMQKNQKIKRPRDPIQLAKLIGDIAIGAVKDKVDDTRNPMSVELGRQGGLIGGKLRAENLTPERRQEIARKAAQKRWSKD